MLSLTDTRHNGDDISRSMLSSVDRYNRRHDLEEVNQVDLKKVKPFTNQGVHHVLDHVLQAATGIRFAHMSF